eukprot:s462_g63.t1
MIGVVFMARFLEDHRATLIQEAVSSPDWMSGNRAVALLRIEPFVMDRRWVARTGAMLFDDVEIEQTPHGLGICIDVRVEPPPAPADATSLAAFTHHARPPQQPVFENPAAALQNPQDEMAEHADDSNVDDSDSDSALQADADEDWRFVHVCLLGRRIYHGRLPWKQPHIIMDHAAELTGVPADDLVHLHYVRHKPADFQAAHVEPLIAQVYTDLAIGSVHRLVLLDVEFHEHFPANDVSASRRCMTVPRVLTRAALLRLTGLSTYCIKAKDRCLVWHNNEPLLHQSLAPFDVHHGD